MKLQLSIPTRPRLIHALAIVDLLAVLFLLPLLANQIAPHGGYELSLPSSPLRLPAQDYAVDVEVKVTDDTFEVLVDNQPVAFEKLPETFKTIAETWSYGGDPIAWFKQDERITVGQSSRVLNLLYKNGYRVLVVGEYDNANTLRE